MWIFSAPLISADALLFALSSTRYCFTRCTLRWVLFSDQLHASLHRKPKCECVQRNTQFYHSSTRNLATNTDRGAILRQTMAINYLFNITRTGFLLTHLITPHFHKNHQITVAERNTFCATARRRHNSTKNNGKLTPRSVIPRRFTQVWQSAIVINTHYPRCSSSTISKHINNREKHHRMRW